MAVHCIVPARMGSSRFPGKPLVKILGKEMILRTMERAVRAECFDRIVCATDSEEIAGVVSRAGFEFVLTGPAATGSDRVAFAAQALGLDLVVNLQGDEPLVEPSVLRDVASALESHPDEWVTVACPLNPAEAELKTVVKVLVKDDYALDFTRSVAVEDASRWPGADANFEQTSDSHSPESVSVRFGGCSLRLECRRGCSDEGALTITGGRG